MAEGSHSLSATVSDAAGNRSAPSAALAVTIDTTPPAAATDLTLTDDQGQTLVDRHTFDSTTTLKGQAEQGSTVIIYDNGQEVGRATVDQQGKWSFIFDPALDAGEHNITTRVSDQAGNYGDYTTGIRFTLDASTSLQVNDDSHTAEVGAEHDNLNGITGSVTQLLGVSLFGLIDVSGLDDNSFSFHVNDGCTEDLQLKISGNTFIGAGAIVQQLLSLLGIKEFTTDLSIVNRSTGKVEQILKNVVTITAAGLGLNYSGEVAVNGLAAGEYSALVTSTSNNGLLATLLDLLAKLNIGVKTDITIDDSVAYLPETTQGNVLHNDNKGDVADTGDDIHVTKIVANNVSGSQAVIVDSHGVTVQGLYGALTIQADGSYSYHSIGDSGNIGKTESFTYTVQDAHGQSKSAQLTVKVEGTHSVAVNDNVSLDDTIVYPDSLAISYNMDDLTISGTIDKNQSYSFDNRIEFSIGHQHSLADVTITLNV